MYQLSILTYLLNVIVWKPNDRHGERWIVGGGSVLLGASMLFAYPVTNYTYVVAILLFVGIWYGTAQPGGSKAIVKWFPPQRRGLAMGIRQTGIPIGGALASSTLPFFFYEYGLPSVILVQAIVAISGGYCLFYFIVRSIRAFKKQKRFPSLQS